MWPPGGRAGPLRGRGGGRAGLHRPWWAHPPGCEPPRAAAGPVGRRHAGRFAPGRLAVGACGRAPRPPSDGLVSSARASAQPPRGRRHRPRPGGELGMAACARAAPCRPAGGPSGRGRCLQRRARWPQRPRRGMLYGQPGPPSACETGAGLTAEVVWCRVRPEAALAARQLTRGATGGQPTHRKS